MYLSEFNPLTIAGHDHGRCSDFLLKHAQSCLAAWHQPVLGFCKLCWYNFEHFRDALAFENNASILGLFSTIIGPTFTSVHKL